MLVACLVLMACDAREGADDAPAPFPNVVMITVDTLRRDHLSIYGYDRETSPRIDALGEKGWVFDNHISHSGQTVPATISMLVSKLPVEHGYLHETPGAFAKNPPVYHGGLLFLQEVLKSHGYSTGAFVSNPFLRRKNAFNQGFDHFVGKHRGRALNKQLLPWLDAQVEAQAVSGQPFFMYLHYLDIHAPYKPERRHRRLYPKPEGAKRAFVYGLAPNVSDVDRQFEINLYDALINQVDELIGQVLDRLEALGVAQNTIVLVTSDHGDEFLEHGGFGHGTSVYGELVNIPLIVFDPRNQESARRISHITQGIDVAPTLLNLVGITPPEEFRGTSVFSRSEVVYSEDGPWKSALTPKGKIVLNVEEGTTQVYSTQDLLDQNPIANPELESKLRSILQNYLSLERSDPSANKSKVGPSWTREEYEQLRALGYVAE